MQEKLRVSMVQSDLVWEDKKSNLKYFEKVLKRVSKKTDLVVLPEMFTTGFSLHTQLLAESVEGETCRLLQKWADEFEFAIVGSFIAESCGKYYNRGFFVVPNGSICFYDKRHLFSMADEDSYYTSGTKRLIASYKGWNVCIQICYDLRFPVWSRNRNNEYDLLIYVANWPETRIKVWNQLLQARAVENCCWVCGVNRVGKDGKGLNYIGHSQLINPKGRVVASAGRRKNVVRTADVCSSELLNLRTKFPIWQDADEFTIQNL